jgi:hypothetical protein
MDRPLAQFKLALFHFFLKARDRLILPVYKGSTFRGAFGHAFKKVVCVNRAGVCEFLKDSLGDERLLPYFIITPVGKHGSNPYGVRTGKGKILIE